MASSTPASTTRANVRGVPGVAATRRKAGGFRGVAPRANTVEQEQGGQDRDRAAHVVRGQQQHVRPVARLRREHDPGRDDRAPEPPARRTIPGGETLRRATRQRSAAGSGGSPPRASTEEGREQHDQGVGHRRGHVDHPGAETQHEFQQGVLRQFGGVEGHVGQRPAMQQQVAVQHVPGLQRVGRAVRVDRLGPGQAQVAGEEHGHGGAGGQAQRPARRPARVPHPLPCPLLQPPPAARSSLVAGAPRGSR